MLKEAMQFIAGLCEEKSKHEFKKVNGHVTLHTQGSKIDYTVSVPETPRRTIFSLDDFRAYVLTRVDHQVDGNNTADSPDEVYTVGTEGSVIFYSTEGIEYLEQPDDKRAIIATMKLSRTDAFQTIIAANWMSQKDFLRTLRINLRGTMSDDILVKAMAKVVFKQQSEAGSAVVQGRQSMSREILQTINDGSTFPEECFFTVKIFNEVETLVRIECAIEVDFDKNIFRITPYADSLEAAKTETMEHINNRLTEACPRCFYGCSEQVD